MDEASPQISSYTYPAPSGRGAAAAASYVSIDVVTTRVVSCDGRRTMPLVSGANAEENHLTLGRAMGHPKVFLRIPRDSAIVVCPYCSHTFMLETTQTKSWTRS